jgi:hypothetical protein
VAKFINKIIIYIIKVLITLYYKNTFNTLKDKGLISNEKSLMEWFDIAYDIYSEVLHSKGLRGLYNYRLYANQDLDKFEVQLRNNPGRIIDFKLYPYLSIFKSMLSKIKLTIEIFMVIKGIFKFISSAAMIPLVILSIYFLIRRILLAISVIFTSSVTSLYLSDNFTLFHHIKITLLSIREFLRVSSLHLHNFIFNESIPVYPEKEHKIISTIIEKSSTIPSQARSAFSEYYNYIISKYNYLIPNYTEHPYIYSIIGGVILSYIIVNNRGIISDSAIWIWDNTKGVGSFILSYFISSKDGTDGGPDGGNPQDNNPNNPPNNPQPQVINPIITPIVPQADNPIIPAIVPAPAHSLSAQDRSPDSSSGDTTPRIPKLKLDDGLNIPPSTARWDDTTFSRLQSGDFTPPSPSSSESNSTTRPWDKDRIIFTYSSSSSSNNASGTDPDLEPDMQSYNEFFSDPDKSPISNSDSGSTTNSTKEE